MFLQAVVVLIGAAILTFLLGEPHLEGRNAHATTFEIYFNDPFLAYVYVGSIPFFVAVYRAFGLLGQFRRNGAFSQETVNALRAIKRCAFIVIGFVAGGAVIILINGDPDDRPAGFFMSFLFTFAASAVALTAAVFERNLQRAIGRRD